jgi:hypothetical protein
VLLSYKAILIIGHNEYWTREVRDRIRACECWQERKV